MKTIFHLITFIALFLPAITFASNTGQNVYKSNCLACHQKDGGGIPGVFPALNSNAILIGDLNKLVDTVVKGRRGTAMQAFGLQLNQAQLTEVIKYIRSSFSNTKTNDDSLSQLVTSALNDLNIQTSNAKNKIQKQKDELNNISSPNSLFSKSYSYEKTNAPIAQYGYKLLIEKYPTSDLMIKAIERLDKIDSK